VSYAIPTKELSLTDIRSFKSGAIEAGIVTAVEKGIGERNQLVVREAFPFTDFGAGAVGWTTEWYRNPAIAAIGWGSPFNAGAVPANVPILPVNRVAVFYKFQDSTPAPMVTAVRFRVGATGASTKASFYIQMPTEGNLEPDVYFSEPVVYEPQDSVYIEFYYTGAVVAGGENFAFGCFIIERVGAVIS